MNMSAQRIGVPFSDPIADGPTIQESSFVALKNGIDIKKCLKFVADARAKGIAVIFPPHVVNLSYLIYP